MLFKDLSEIEKFRLILLQEEVIEWKYDNIYKAQVDTNWHYTVPELSVNSWNMF